MKNWFASSLCLLGLLLSSSEAGAVSLAEGFTCLQEGNLPCARASVDEHRRRANDPEYDFFEATVLFHEGSTVEAGEKMRALAERNPDLFGPEGEYADDARLYIATAEVHADMVEEVVGNVTVLYRPGLDKILIEETIEALGLAQQRIAPLLGGAPPIPVRVEFYADGASFTTCSSLPLEAVQTTGVIAISKWNRLLLTSPRALGRGYGWKDTLVHEWIHGVVSWHSRDRAPVWLQEGMAKGLDMLWHRSDFELPVEMQSALARALREDDFVGFEEMRYSFAFLESADRANLAYAQVASQMAYLREISGSDALARLLQELEDGNDVDAAISHIYPGSFEDFLVNWKTWLGTLPLVQERLAAMPTVLDGQGGDFAEDPVLAERQDLANFARLGDLMRQRSHYEGALVYYEQATPEDEPSGPLLVQRKAEVLMALGRDGDAEHLLRASHTLYPEFAATRKLLGDLLLAQGENAQALVEYRASADINPFDLEVQEQLVLLFRETGQQALAQRHQRYTELLNFETD